MGLFALRHTQEGHDELARLLARKYVRRGAYWLNRHAPRGWFRNCMNAGSSRIHTSYGNEGVLAIAFEYHQEFADNSGYINEGKVLRHFDLWMHSRKCYLLGFDTPFNGFSPFSTYYCGITITNEHLDVAWAELLKNPPADWRIPYRHPTALDRQFAELDFLREKPRFSLKRMFKRKKPARDPFYVMPFG